jgi:hypothetical protein
MGLRFCRVPALEFAMHGDSRLPDFGFRTIRSIARMPWWRHVLSTRELAAMLPRSGG